MNIVYIYIYICIIMIYSIYLAVHSLIYIIDFVIYVPQWNTSSNLYSTYTLSPRMLHHIITIKLDKLRTMIRIEFISTSLKSLSGEGQWTISMTHICQLWPSSYLSAGQTTSHYVKQCSPLSILSFGFTRPQCVNECRWSCFTILHTTLRWQWQNVDQTLSSIAHNIHPKPYRN